MTSPHVLLLGPALVGGGCEQRFRLAAQHVLGGSADVVCSAVPSDPFDAALGKSVLGLGCRTESDYPKAVLTLRRHLSRRRYDLIAAFGHFPGLLAWAATRGLAKRPRLLLFEISRPAVLHAIGRRPQDRMVNALQKRAYAAADAVAANSIDGAEECVTHFHVRETKVTRVPNLVDSAQLRARAAQPIDAPWPSMRPFITVACRLERYKLVDTVLTAFVELRHAFPNFWLVILGEGPERSSLGARAAELGIDDRVHFAGWRPNPLPWVAGGTVLVHPSLFEGFSNTVLEAMFLDTPVAISFSSRDAREMCMQGAAAGFRPGDGRALASRLFKLLASEKERMHLTNRAASYRAPHELASAIPVYDQVIVSAAVGDPLPRPASGFSLHPGVPCADAGRHSDHL